MTWDMTPEEAEESAIRMLSYKPGSQVVPSRPSEQLHRCPVCFIYFLPTRTNQTYCRDVCRASAHDAVQRRPAEMIRATNPKEASYVVNRLRNGSWQAWVAEPGKTYALTLPEWRQPGMYKEHPRSDLVISDDSEGAPRMAHEMILRAHQRIDRDIGPYWSGNAENQLICREFAEERLWPMYPGQTAAWTETFLRDWYEDRRRRVLARYGSQSFSQPSAEVVKKDIQRLVTPYFQDIPLRPLELEGLTALLVWAGMYPAAEFPLEIKEATENTRPGQPRRFELSLEPVNAYRMISDGTLDTLKRIRITLSKQLIPTVRSWQIWHSLRAEPSGTP